MEDTTGSWDAKAVVNLLLMFVLIASIATTIDVDALQQHTASYGRGVALCICCQYIVLPALAFGVSTMLDLGSLYSVGLIVMACCPGGAMSNILCFVFQADVTLSVVMTGVSSAGAVVMMPLNTYLYAQCTGIAGSITIDLMGIVASALSVVLGAALGLVSVVKIPQIVKPIQVGGALAALGVILMGLIGNAQSSTPIWQVPGKVFAACAMVVGCGGLCGFGLGLAVALPKPACVAVCIETSVQNKLVATAVLAVTLSGDERNQAYAVPMVYASFATSTSICVALLCWKAGFTNLPFDATFSDIVHAWRRALEGASPSAPDGTDATEETEVAVATNILNLECGSDMSVSLDEEDLGVYPLVLGTELCATDQKQCEAGPVVGKSAMVC